MVAKRDLSLDRRVKRNDQSRSQGERARCAERSSSESPRARARVGGANGTRPDARIARELVGVSV